MTIARVSIQRLETYEPDAVRAALQKLLAPLGGIQAFVLPGQKVVLKPNLLKPATVDEAVSTHPEIIAQMADLAATQGPTQLLITDSPGIGSATRIAKKLGLRESASWKVVNADEAVLMSLPEDGQGHPQLRISKIIAEADAVINLAKAKTHGQMIITAASKNTFGAVVGLEKAQWHYRIGKNPDTFADLIVHIHQAVSPILNIVDAVIGMEGNGPDPAHPGNSVS